jgi:acyl transferase domain-containing protein/phosphopantetheinyl transferase
MTGNENPADVAIVGMACVFPGAPDLTTYWHNIVGKVDAICDPPPEWGHETVLDPHSNANGRIYNRRGGYLGDLARFNPVEYGTMPVSVNGGEPDHFLTLKVAHEALADAGYKEGRIDRSRVAVILGRGAYINRGNANLFQHGLVVDQTIRILRQLNPEYLDQDLEDIKRRLNESLPPFNADVAPGLVPNLVSGRIANRLDFMGPNYTVDAACASSLIAIDLGLRELMAGRCDMAIVGGIHVSTPPEILMIFCQLNALSRKPHLSPFDRDADGTLLGEGLGILVLRRREDAERDGDRIYALIRSVGIASDGRALGLLAPRVEGEELAMRRAYEPSGISPRTVELIEAHGTGTPVGDEVEIQAIRRVFGERSGAAPWCALGSVKSMIGHPMPAAGAAGVVKAALALFHKVLPPTLHCDTPNPAFDLEKAPFYINTEARPWIHGAPTPRRAGVNAFGFGGINAHVILEEYTGVDESVGPSLLQRWDSEVLMLQGRSRDELREKAARLKGYLQGFQAVELKDLAYTLSDGAKEGEARLSIVASNPGELTQKLDYALGKLSEPSCHRIKERSGIYYFSEPLGREGKVAFLFPGEGSPYIGMLSDLCMRFPEVRSRFDFMDRAFAGHGRDCVPSQFIFPPPLASSGDTEDRKLLQMDIGSEAAFAANQAILALLSRLRLRPDFIVGHSAGEYSALLAAGAMRIESEAELIEHVRALNRLYQGLLVGDMPEGMLLAVGGVERDRIDAVLSASPEPVYVAMDNCPSQTVLCGSKIAVDEASARLRAEGAMCMPFPFDRPYHTPLFEPVIQSLRPFFDALPVNSPAIPIYSCATAAPMPSDPTAIRSLVSAQWTRRVRFRETVENLYAAGARIFIETGPNGILTGFVDDILRSQPHLAAAVDSPRRSGTVQLNHLIGLLFAHHAPMDVQPLYSRRNPRRLSLDVNADQSVYFALTQVPRLPLNIQPLQLRDAPARSTVGAKRVSPDPAAHPSAPMIAGPGERLASQALPASGDRRQSTSVVMAEYFRTMEHFLRVQRGVLERYLGGKAANISLSEDPSHQATQQAEPRPASPLEAQVTEPSLPLSERPSAAAEKGVGQVLLDLVAERTGYPVETVGLDLSLEADLGIDSIKRVEILGVALRQLGLSSRVNLDELTRLKTLGEIIEALENRSASSAPKASEHERSRQAFALLGAVTAFDPGRRLEAVREFDPEEDVFLRHHTLGGAVSTFDEALMALPVMPLTMSVEMLAQAAAALVPDKRLIGMREIRAHRWITLDSTPVKLMTTAQSKSDSGDPEVAVQVRDITETPGVRAPVVVEGIAVFADTYPPSPSIPDFPLEGERPSRWKPENLYTEGMFHGPTFQGVASVDRVGTDGIAAILRVLPRDQLFRSFANPAWVTDPVLLDAAGQLVGYWSAEHFKIGFNVFPFRVRALELFGPLLASGEKVLCRARIRLGGEAQTSSDIELVDARGSLWSRLVGWEDRRFDFPDEFYRLRIQPKTAFLSEDWPQPIAHLPDGSRIACCLLRPLPHGLMNDSHGIWQRVLAHLVLSRRERPIWRDFGASSERRMEWLLGRIAAKDAVRKLLRRHYDLEICPADVEILPDEYGRPQVFGPWIAQIGDPLLVSITHSRGYAAAAACLPGECAGIGVDMEPVQGNGREVRSLAESFAPEEQALISGPEALGEEWLLRLWCAKEAIAKALGRGLMGRLRDFVAVDVDRRSGRVRFSVKERETVGHLESGLEAVTRIESDWVTAVSIYQRS